MSRTCAATLRETTRRRPPRSEATTRGRIRTPRLAIVAPTEAIWTAVARSRSWPIAAEPTARSSLRSRAIVLGFSVGSRGFSLKP